MTPDPLPVCRQCRKRPPMAGSTYCVECLNRHMVYERARRAKRKAAKEKGNGQTIER